MAYDYIKYDLAGYPFNYKYPPNYNLYGSEFHGYKDPFYETFFYDFAVQRYDLRFTYKNKTYYFLSKQDYAALCNENFTEEYERFKDGNAVLEEFIIEGKSLLELIPDIKDCEPI